MRTIKFRGKRLDGSGWVYGDLIHENNGNVAIKTNLDTWGENDDTIGPYGEYVLVKPHTVGQYTGLKDKEGRDIYEGDIILVPVTKGLFVVEWRTDDIAMFVARENGREQWYHLSGAYYEVIGNIHDNPELPKGGNE